MTCGGGDRNRLFKPWKDGRAGAKATVSAMPVRGPMVTASKAIRYASRVISRQKQEPGHRDRTTVSALRYGLFLPGRPDRAPFNVMHNTIVWPCRPKCRDLQTEPVKNERGQVFLKAAHVEPIEECGALIIWFRRQRTSTSAR